jgi:hypothetical protein
MWLLLISHNKLKQENVTCSDILNESRCSTSHTSLDLECIWIETEIDIDIKKCQKISSSCESIEREASCLTEGSAKAGENIISCFWLKKSSTEEGKCISLVCLF